LARAFLQFKIFTKEVYGEGLVDPSSYIGFSLRESTNKGWLALLYGKYAHHKVSNGRVRPSSRISST